MGFVKPKNEDNPPFSSSQSDQFVVTSKGCEASDTCQIAPVNNTSTPAWENAHGMHQSYTQDSRNNMTGFTRPATSQMAHGDHSFIDLRGSLRNRDTCSSGLNHPQANLNFIPNQSNIPGGGYYVSAPVGVATTSDLNRPQIAESSLYSRYNPYIAQSTRETFVNNNAKSVASDPGKFDGSFLTLGTGGGNAESRTKHKLSSRGIASCLGKSGDPRVGQTAPKCSTLGQNFTGPQNCYGGFPGSMSNGLGALNVSSFHNERVPNYDMLGLGSNALQGPHMPEAITPHDFFQSSDSSLGIASKSLGAYPSQGPYNQYQGNPASSSLPFNSTDPYSSHPGFTKFPGQASESTNFVRTTFRPTTGQFQNYLATSFYASNPIIHTANPATQDYVGKLLISSQGSMTQAVGRGPSIGGQPVGHIASSLGVSSAISHGNTTFSGKMVPHLAEATAMRPATVSPLPRRLGVQPYYVPQLVNQEILPRVLGVQTRGGEHQSHSFQIPSSFLGPPSGTGYPPDGLRPQFNVQTPIFSSGPAMLNAQAYKRSQVSNATGQPSLKRKTAEPPAVASWSRRNKLLHPSTIPNCAIYQRKGSAANLPPPCPSATPHIRWQGFEKSPQPAGTKCLLCKRDLSFTPEGNVYQPSIPPPVAVLPCGHAFHDECLERITPEGQSADPPCIPCAIGET